MLSHLGRRGLPATQPHCHTLAGAAGHTATQPHPGGRSQPSPQWGRRPQRDPFMSPSCVHASDSHRAEYCCPLVCSHAHRGFRAARLAAVKQVAALLQMVRLRGNLCSGGAVRAM
eukprot:357261-Chlamydomonas_euryale.AAC.2